jgi:hypothetical protein
MKIVIIQDGGDANLFCCLSLLIGLQKAYSAAQIIWIGQTYYLKLVRFNRRVADIVNIEAEMDFSLLSKIYKPDLCICTSNSKLATHFASQTKAEKHLGFLNGPVDRSAVLFEKVVSGKTRTNKHLLDLYYQLAGLSWDGEGFGIGYYPRVKQSDLCGFYLCGTGTPPEGCERFGLPHDVLRALDVINKYENIYTDDEFVAFAGIALRKNVTFRTRRLPYKIQFFGKGSLEEIGE